MEDKQKSLVGKNPSIIATFLEPFFSKLDGKNVLWAVAHGWEGLPHYARHDVDLVIDKHDLKTAIKALEETVSQTGWLNYAHFKFSNLHSYWILLPGDEISYFQIDIFTEASLRGIPFYSSRNALSHRWKNTSGIWCMPYSYSGTSVMLKELIANSKLERESRYQQVRDGLEKDRPGFLELLQEAFRGDGALVKDVMDAVSASDWGKLESLAQKIRKKVMRPRLCDFFGILVYVYDNLRMRLFPFLRPFVAFLGPDGCGKTTVADKIEEIFDHRPFVSKMRIHSHFSNTIRLRDLYRWLMSKFGRKVEFAPDPVAGTKGMGMKPPLGMLRSMFYVLYNGLWLALGRMVLFRWRAFSGILIADRYYYDYYYMRGHIKCPIWWKDFIGAIVPKPNMVFVLERSAKEIYEKKPELDVEEIERQQKAIRSRFLGEKKFYFIDASKGVDATVAKVRLEIEQWIINYGR